MLEYIRQSNQFVVLSTMMKLNMGLQKGIDDAYYERQTMISIWVLALEAVATLSSVFASSVQFK